MVPPLWKIVWPHIKTLNIISIRLSIFTSTYTPKNTKSYTRTHTKKTLTQILIAALFVITEKHKQAKCLSTDEWINTVGISLQSNVFSHNE